MTWELVLFGPCLDALNSFVRNLHACTRALVATAKSKSWLYYCLLVRALGPKLSGGCVVGYRLIVRAASSWKLKAIYSIVGPTY